jgi:CBS domain-containing protein
MALLARDLMQRDAITIPPDAPFSEIQHLMVVANISGTVVVDDSGVVLGVISASDLLRVADQAFDDEIDSIASSSGAVLPEALGSLTAIDIATPEAIWVSPECSAFEAAQIMRAEGIHRVLVGDDGELAGILTAFDLLRAVRS